MDSVYSLYYSFLAYFPGWLHGPISIVLALLIIYAVFQVIRRHFLFLILLIILLPQSVPILKTIWESVYQFVRFLIGR